MGMHERGDGQHTIVVTVKKDELVKILTSNRDTHVADFKTACEVYKAKVLDELTSAEKTLGWFKANWKEAGFDKLPAFPELTRAQCLPRPVSYENHYNRALGMLKLHTKDEMTLDLATYQRYVEDDWEWTERAKVSNSRYLPG